MKETGPECSICPIGNNEALCSIADLVRKVYVSDAFASLPPEGNMVVAEDKICRGEITPDDINRLAAALQTDIDLSLTCFVDLHETARSDRETLAALIAVAGCATQRLRRICEL
jgi:hypothetical protein